jgi:putative endonuclease
MLPLPNLPSGWCCYLLLCDDSSYYCGVTSDLGQRVRDHTFGKGGGYTKETKHRALVWYERHDDRGSAAAREKQIKNWNKTKKLKLSKGQPPFVDQGAPVLVSLR